jgi:hypothetical protein
MPLGEIGRESREMRSTKVGGGLRIGERSKVTSSRVSEEVRGGEEREEGRSAYNCMEDLEAFVSCKSAMYG